MHGVHRRCEAAKRFPPPQQRFRDIDVRGRPARDLALDDRQVRSANTRRLASSPELRGCCPLSGVDVDHQTAVGAQVRGAIELQVQLELWGEAPADCQYVAWHGGAAFRDGQVRRVQCNDADRLEVIVAKRLHDGVPSPVGRAMSRESGEVLDAFQEFSWGAEQSAWMTEKVAWRIRLDHSGHGCAAVQDPRGHRQKKRSSPGDDHPLARDHAVPFEQSLHPACGKHTGQVPSREGQLPVVRAGGEDQAAPTYRSRGVREPWLGADRAAQEKAISFAVDGLDVVPVKPHCGDSVDTALQREEGVAAVMQPGH